MMRPSTPLPLPFMSPSPLRSPPFLAPPPLPAPEQDILWLEVAVHDAQRLEEAQGGQDLVRKAAYEAQAEADEVVLLDELVQVGAQQLKRNAQVAAEVKVLLRGGEGGGGRAVGGLGGWVRGAERGRAREGGAGQGGAGWGKAASLTGCRV